MVNKSKVHSPNLCSKAHYRPLPPKCCKCSNPAIHEWHSTLATVWWYHIQTSFKSNTYKVNFQNCQHCSWCYPASTASAIHLYTSNIMLNINQTGHITLHLCFNPCQFLFILHSVSLHVSRSVSPYQLHPNKKTNDHLLIHTFLEF